MKHDNVPTNRQGSPSSVTNFPATGLKPEGSPAPIPPDVTIAINLPMVGWVRESTVLQCIEISKSTMWVWIKNGMFPAPTRLGPRVTAWSARSLRRYIDDPGNWTPETPANNSTHEVLS